ncbi:MAG: biotin--[acetyl-CoA-carboxylase] ligase [Bacteroidetes bacterium GWA2_30_7]|nr:MAG: biotin--[acetyl-CoA-carboxylase] ligase [Bacteroidetes bacterium GWA2_30_7]
MATIGKQIINIESIDSTMSYVKNNLINSDKNEGIIVSCISQTDGRGQLNNFWESEAGKNITISFFIKPKDFIDISDQFKISVLVAVSVYDFIKMHVNKNVSIKWPNDVYYENKKIAGILIEHSIELNKLESTLIGIGININQEIFKSDAPNPISLKSITNQTYNLETLIIQLADILNKNMFVLKTNYQILKDIYLKNLFHKNTFHKYIYKNNNILAKITDINNYGHLILETEEGTVISCDMNEIKHIVE